MNSPKKPKNEESMLNLIPIPFCRQVISSIPATKSQIIQNNKHVESDFFCEEGNDVIAIAMYENLMRLQNSPSPATKYQVSRLDLPLQRVTDEKSS